MSSGQNSTSNSVQSTRGKCDPAWDHVTEGRTHDGKRTITCLYCTKTIKGGGINRMKQHLAAKSGEVGPCKKVPLEVKYQMEQSLKSITDKKKQATEEHEQESPYCIDFDDDFVVGDDVDVVEIIPKRKGGISINEGRVGGSSYKGKGTMLKKGNIDEFFAPRTTPGAQPSIKSVLAGKEAVHKAHMLTAKYLYDTCTPFNAVNSVYFQKMFDAAIAIGPGYKVPSYHDVRVPLLRDSKKELTLFIESLKNTWADCGCTVMGDGWTDGRERTLINFLVYCPRGIAFIKSVDASDVVKDAAVLFRLFKEVVDWVGARNVVHMVTDNGANYVAAGKLISEEYENINWSPCAAHCLNLLLGDIAELENVTDLVKKASKVTSYVYNRVNLLSWLRKRKSWNEIVRPGPTRFATTFIALGSIYT